MAATGLRPSSSESIIARLLPPIGGPSEEFDDSSNSLFDIDEKGYMRSLVDSVDVVQQPYLGMLNPTVDEMMLEPMDVLFPSLGVNSPQQHPADQTDPVVTSQTSDIPGSTHQSQNPSTKKKYKNARNLAPEEKKLYQELRRQSHITAEQRRRGRVKKGIDRLKSMVINPADFPSGKINQATVLEKAAEYIQQQEKKIQQLEDEVKELKDAQTIPTTTN